VCAASTAADGTLTETTPGALKQQLEAAALNNEVDRPASSHERGDWQPGRLPGPPYAVYLGGMPDDVTADEVRTMMFPGVKVSSRV
jgi:hypothetical protein